MKPEKDDKSVRTSARTEGLMVDLLNTEMRQLQDSMFISDLKKLASSIPHDIYKKILDLLGNNLKLAEENTILTNKLSHLSEELNLYKDANESIKSKAAILVKENSELRDKLQTALEEGALQLAFAIERNLAYYDDKDTFSKEYILSLISVVKTRGCQTKEIAKDENQ